jgi:hypothetical protein
MGGGWNYKRLRLLAHKHQTISQMKMEQFKEKLQKEEKKFPSCQGTFDDCPQGEIDPEDMPKACRMCPEYHKISSKEIESAVRKKTKKKRYGLLSK